MRGVLALLATGGLGWLLYSRLRDAAPSAKPPDANDLDPAFAPDTAAVSVSAGKSAAHKAARPIIETAFSIALNRAGTREELQYVQAVADAETSYGRGWNDTRCPGGAASNNWGAVQAKSGAAQFPCEDSQPDGTKYKQGFRVYATPAEGAADVVKHVLVHRPKTAGALNSSGATIYRASYAMRREVYYGGFCPKATSRYGSEVAKASVSNPDRDEGTKACAREAIEMHAKRIHGIIKEIASVLGEKPLPLGTFDDADQWYRRQYVA